MSYDTKIAYLIKFGFSHTVNQSWATDECRPVLAKIKLCYKCSRLPKVISVRMFRLALILVALVAAVSASRNISTKKLLKKCSKWFCCTAVPEIFRGGRIVGGQAAALGQFPYQASMRTAGNFHFCGGVIISNQWVLSAAHCTIGRAQTAVFVVVGTITLNAGGISHQSAQIVNHPDYNAQWISNE